MLFLPSGEPLTDVAGNQLKTGQTVTDVLFGDGLVRGTVPLEKGEGVNVLIDWLVPKDGKPESRGAERLTAKYPSGGGETTTRMHTGAEYESGTVYERRGRNDADAARLRAENGEDMGEAAGAQSPPRAFAAGSPRSTRASPGAANSPRDDRTAAQEARGEAEDELQALLRKPWRGQATKLKAAQRSVLDQFEEKGVREKKFDDGVAIEIATTKYWVKWDGEATARTTKTLNITRMFEALLASKNCPGACLEREERGGRMGGERASVTRSHVWQMKSRRAAPRS